MSLADFRATRRIVPIAAAIAEHSYIGDVEYPADYTHAALYDGGFYILQSRGGWYLDIEGDEYLTRDLALLEFVLWHWAEAGDHMIDSRNLIWG
jgi:hypothetical protein